MTTPAHEHMSDITTTITAADVAATSRSELDALSRRMAKASPVGVTPKVRATALFLTMTARRRLRERDPAMTGCDGRATR